MTLLLVTISGASFGLTWVKLGIESNGQMLPTSSIGNPITECAEDGTLRLRVQLWHSCNTQPWTQFRVKIEKKTPNGSWTDAGCVFGNTPSQQTSIYRYLNISSETAEYRVKETIFAVSVSSCNNATFESAPCDLDDYYGVTLGTSINVPPTSLNTKLNGQNPSSSFTSICEGSDLLITPTSQCRVGGYAIIVHRLNQNLSQVASINSGNIYTSVPNSIDLVNKFPVFFYWRL